jgi:chromosome segregation ATPase
MRAALLAALLIAAPAALQAQDTPEDRLRAALRQSVEEMRTAQDQAAQAQSQLAQAQSDLAATKAQLDAANAKLAAGAGKPAAKPEELQQLQASLQAAQQQHAALQQGLAQAQEIARQKDAVSRQAQAGLAGNTKALETCKATNAKLIAVSEQVLNLWRDRSFLWVLRKSYEPIIGADKVTLENLVQDYDDKIRDQEYIPPQAGHR